MGDRRERIARSVKVGVLATVVMDAAFLGAARLGGSAFTSEKIAPDLVGRWVVGLLHGRVRQDVAQDAPVPGEALAGIGVHYLTGITLAGIYLEGAHRTKCTPGAASGAAYGAVTALLPWLVMYPSWGLGLFGRHSGETGRLIRIMLFGHTVFGAAIGAFAGRTTTSASSS